MAVSNQRVFLCHASDDKAAVRALYRRLVADGVAVWLDEEELLPGEFWEPAIRKAVQASAFVVVCLSARSVTKEGFVQKEIRFALDAADYKPEGKPYLIPARLERCEVPERLRHLHWVDLFEARGYKRLLKSIGGGPLPAVEPRAKPVRSDGGRWLVLSDGTEFADDLARLAGERARVEVARLRNLEDVEVGGWLERHPVVVLTRGEHFQELGAWPFYRALDDYVRRGGVLVATPWVSWEVGHGFGETRMLPFRHPARRFVENVEVECHCLSWMEARCPEPFGFVTSLEVLQVPAAGDGVELLVETREGIPILGGKQHGLGRCYYLNVCQHSCKEPFPSPALMSSGLGVVLGSLFWRIAVDLGARMDQAPQGGVGI